MPFMTFAAGQTLTAAEMNTYLARQSVIVCTSTTRPSSPPEGMTIWETDTDRLLVYTSAATSWQPPWNISWGIIGSAQITASVTNTTLADTAGLVTPSISVPANRKLRVSFSGGIYSSAAEGCRVDLLQGTTQIRETNVMSSTNVFATNVSALAIVTSTAGSLTWKVQHGRATGAAGNITLYATSTSPAQLVVEDIGPAGAPL